MSGELQAPFHLGRLCQRPRCAQVDVEGHELEVLRSIRDEHWRGIRQVVMEVEDAATQQAVVDLLRRRGFAVECKPSALKDLLDKSELVDLYAWRPRR